MRFVLDKVEEVSVVTCGIEVSVTSAGFYLSFILELDEGRGSSDGGVAVSNVHGLLSSQESRRIRSVDSEFITSGHSQLEGEGELICVNKIVNLNRNDFSVANDNECQLVERDVVSNQLSCDTIQSRTRSNDSSSRISEQSSKTCECNLRSRRNKRVINGKRVSRGIDRTSLILCHIERNCLFWSLRSLE